MVWSEAKCKYNFEIKIRNCSLGEVLKTWNKIGNGIPIEHWRKHTEKAIEIHAVEVEYEVSDVIGDILNLNYQLELESRIFFEYYEY